MKAVETMAATLTPTERMQVKAFQTEFKVLHKSDYKRSYCECFAEALMRTCDDVFGGALHKAVEERPGLVEEWQKLHYRKK